MPMIGKRAGSLVERNKETGAEIWKFVNRKKQVMYFVWQLDSSVGMLRNSLALAREAAGIEHKPIIDPLKHGVKTNTGRASKFENGYGKKKAG